MRIREISPEATGGISLFFAFFGVAFSVTSCDAQLRVKRGSGGLGAEPANKQEASRARDALLAKMKNHRSKSVFWDKRCG